MLRGEQYPFSPDCEAIDKVLKREIHLARNIQTQLLNGKRPKLINGEVTGTSIPARLVGGDYFDFYPLSNGRLRIVIGDVMGKGIPAAMLMILTRGAFRSAAESTAGPGETLIAMNNALFEDLRLLRSFVTVLCADWDPWSRILTYANAGHSMPFWIRGDGEVEVVPLAEGVMLGGLRNQYYQARQVTLEKNHSVFFYTDGIIEADNPKGEHFRQERLGDVLRQCYRINVQDIQNRVIAAIKDFTEEKPQRDDITMVVLNVGENDMDPVTGNIQTSKA